MKVEPKTDKVHVWKLGDLHYIRTNAHTDMACMDGSGQWRGRHEVLRSASHSRIMISQAGSMQTLVLSDVIKTGSAECCVAGKAMSITSTEKAPFHVCLLG